MIRQACPTDATEREFQIGQSHDNRLMLPAVRRCSLLPDPHPVGWSQIQFLSGLDIER